MAVGTDLLFENHSIKEIQEIEKKLRNDIERKKEELRQMVGERYRDLMDAADTITEMKDIAAGVTSYVKSIENRCMQLQQSSLNGGMLIRIQEKVVERRRQNSLLYTIASLIKILMDSPEKIWSFIEYKDFVSAVSLFLLARHTHSLLVLDPSYQEHKISQKFPIINRQWTSINHLKYVLLQSCELVLETQNVEPQCVVGPLCCHCLLSNSSLEDVLLKILETRKNVIQSIFRPEKYAKDQICEFVTVIQMTLQILYVLLYYEEGKSDNDKETNLLYQTLKCITAKEEKGPVALFDMESCEAFKFLPEVIIGFRPSMKQPVVPCRIELLQSKSTEWLNDIKNSFHSELVNLLSYVNTVKSIALIRQAVISILCESKYWDEVSNKLLQRSFSIWDFFLKECFFQRIKDIIYEHIRCASSNCQKNIEEVLSLISNKNNINFEYEQNIASYIWLEGTDDIMDNVAWISRHQRNLWNSGELSMKSMGFTPKIQSICNDLDQQMKDAVEDVSTFSYLESEAEDSWLKDEQFRHQQLLMSADAVHTFPFLMEAVKHYIYELSSFIETTLSYLKCEKEDFGNSCRIVFLGHLSHAITHLCFHINTCLSSEKLIESTELYKGQGTKFSISVVIKECDLWKQIKKKLLEICSLAFQIWSESHINHLLKTVDTDMKSSSAESLLKSLLRWDKVEIQEESEQGNAVKSVLKIPQYISTPLSNALFAFCCKLNSIGGYVIHSDVRSHISKELLSGLLNVYKRKVDIDMISEEPNPRLLQVQSLQLLFDVQFLMGLMVHKDNSSDEISQLSQEIINKSVSYIDPFDMDVFATPLQQNLKKALQKSLSLYGLLASPDQVTYLNSIKASVINTQMEHNIMLSSISGSRFPLLPLSSRTNIMNISSEADYGSAQKERESKTLPSHRSSPNLNTNDIPTNPMKSTSFYDRVTAMSSSWFGN